jgi:hypothetical protein
VVSGGQDAEWWVGRASSGQGRERAICVPGGQEKAMPMSGDVPIDEVALVHAWMQLLCSGDRTVAEDWTVEVVSRFRRGEGPPWLQPRDPLLRLHYFAVAVALTNRPRSGTTDDVGPAPVG